MVTIFICVSAHALIVPCLPDHQVHQLLLGAPETSHNHFMMTNDYDKTCHRQH